MSVRLTPPEAPSNLHDLQRQTFRELTFLFDARFRDETQSASEYEKATSAAEKEFQRVMKSLNGAYEHEIALEKSRFESLNQSLEESFRKDCDDLIKKRDERIVHINRESALAEEKAKSGFADAKWSADSVLEATLKDAAHDRDTSLRQAKEFLNRIQNLGVERDSTSRIAQPETAPLTRLSVSIQTAEALSTELQTMRSPQFIGGLGASLFTIPLMGCVGTVGFILAEKMGAAVGAVLGLLIGITGFFLFRKQVKARVTELTEQLQRQIQLAYQAHEDFLNEIQQTFRTRVDQAKQRRALAIQQAEEHYLPYLDEIKTLQQNGLKETERKYREALEEQTKSYHQVQSENLAKHRQICDRIERNHNQKVKEAETVFQTKMSTANQKRQNQTNAITQAWTEGQERIVRAINKMRATGYDHFPDWNSLFWKNYPAPVSVPKGVRFGEFQIDLNQLPGGLPTEEGMEFSLPSQFKLPAFLPFPDRCTLLMRATGEGKAAGVRALQGIMLRLLTAIPAGKVRFTVIDPAGLGENFAGFMHLTDYDEQLINSRIWTEPQHIEQRLADLTAHMELIIQKYLRNQYRTIEEYNAQAGEVAEPFRVLVVANFPMNFTAEAARRLASIVHSGPACGVYTLLTHDSKLPLPTGFDMAELESHSIVLTWKEGHFQWKDPDFKIFPMTLESPPPIEELNRLVKKVGERGKDANRVEVPFEFVAPAELWQASTALGISVPVGRAGATKRQHLELGKGTSQHALVAGKTGSGKSTFLHALITNLALTYSPVEVQLYLIDFKKGVEFKPYASYRLPHAQVVSVESEREFGLSVLQRLDLELRNRGEAYRLSGVNSLAEYREKNPEQPMPRIVLLVDEFQEFFIEDDRIAQEAGLLLDRLVRQGRAFGVHVVLGSQTLGGAYALARSTMDQMGVRIALQCSEADAQLILSKDNTAARLLTRPGEAIYNAAGGAVEGNDLFQIVWLDDNKREELLQKIRHQADAQFPDRFPTPIIFEGTTRPLLDECQPLQQQLAQTEIIAPKAPVAWVGDPIAIKPATGVTFRPIGGNNLLIIGGGEEGSLSLFVSSLLSLALQYPQDQARFYILDGTPEDDPNSGLLGRISRVLPHNIYFLDRANLAEVLSELASEVAARHKGQGRIGKVFVMVNGIQRFRDLRKEEDFGFRRDKTVSAADHFSSITKDGPPVGVWTLVSADTYTNVSRILDRNALRDYTLRILFQMSANDSANLIDSPAASRLGRHRALLITDELAQPEKFRPYELPTRELIISIRNKWEALTENSSSESNSEGNSERNPEGNSEGIPDQST
jgi:energy-coupling factor transporter ATP-binding protein EcfA2